MLTTPSVLTDSILGCLPIRRSSSNSVSATSYPFSSSASGSSMSSSSSASLSSPSFLCGTDQCLTKKTRASTWARMLTSRRFFRLILSLATLVTLAFLLASGISKNVDSNLHSQYPVRMSPNDIAAITEKSLPVRKADTVIASLGRGVDDVVVNPNPKANNAGEKSLMGGQAVVITDANGASDPKVTVGSRKIMQEDAAADAAKLVSEVAVMKKEGATVPAKGTTGMDASTRIPPDGPPRPPNVDPALLPFKVTPCTTHNIDQLYLSRNVGFWNSISSRLKDRKRAELKAFMETLPEYPNAALLRRLMNAPVPAEQTFLSPTAAVRADDLPGFSGRGIVMSSSGKTFKRALTSIRLLRHYKCNLPVEVWYFQGELSAKQLAALREVNAVGRDILNPLGGIDDVSYYTYGHPSSLVKQRKKAASFDSDAYFKAHAQVFGLDGFDAGTDEALGKTIQHKYSLDWFKKKLEDLTETPSTAASSPTTDAQDEDEELAKKLKDVETRDMLEILKRFQGRNWWHPYQFVPNYDPKAQKNFQVKSAAIILSSFAEVLYLDSDNILLKDPTFLFDTPEYKKYGALFWPDLWKPHPKNPMFELLNLQCSDVDHQQYHDGTLMNKDVYALGGWEQEAGQLVIDKRRGWKALIISWYFQQDDFFYFPFMNGDKDTFRIAYTMTGTPYFMNPHFQATVGNVIGTEPGWSPTDRFCGHTMMQHDLNGAPLFAHANLVKISRGVDRGTMFDWVEHFVHRPLTRAAPRLGPADYIRKNRFIKYEGTVPEGHTVRPRAVPGFYSDFARPCVEFSVKEVPIDETVLERTAGPFKDAHGRSMTYEHLSMLDDVELILEPFEDYVGLSLALIEDMYYDMGGVGAESDI